MAKNSQSTVADSILNFGSEIDSESKADSVVEKGFSPITDCSSQTGELLDKDPFGNEKSKKLFEAIDELRSCGAGQDIDLPQLVIVGKQSAGKSSLLEGLTDIPFPVGGNLCTRFATRIISRRTAPGTPDLISVSIEPGDVDDFRDSDHNDKTRTFSPSVTSMNADSFKSIVEQACAAMGVKTKKEAKGKNFSSKVLKIELSGPNRSHFGILDVPGIFGSPVGDLTEEDKQGVERMAISYMKKPGNIIICVADAFDDLATQSILGLATKNADSERIVGVFTKCDRTDHPEHVVQTVLKKEGVMGKPLRHGWYVVRNRSTKDNPLLFDRDQTENSLFSMKPWCDIEKERRGTSMLKIFLSNLLCQRIRDSFPRMQKVVDILLDEEKSHLNTFGNSRESTAEQRAYLVGITQKFQDLAKQALKSPEDLPSDNMKLRGLVERSKASFATKMRQNGHFYEFIDPNEVGKASNSTAAGPISADRRSSRISSSRSANERTLYDEIRTQIRVNKGEELQGMVNPAVMKPLFQKQASNWLGLAKQHLEELAELTENASLCILECVCKELGGATYTEEELEAIIHDFATVSRRKALEELDRAWLQEATLHLHTNNPKFIQNVQAAQLLRFKAALKRYKEKKPPVSFLMQLVNNNPNDIPNIPLVYEDWAIVGLNDIGALFEEMNSRGEKNTEDEIHDRLKAYYEVALEDFISYVNKHIAEPFLHADQGPVFGLSTGYILNLTDDKIEQLGGEDESTLRERKKTEATIMRLEVAKKIAEQAFRKTRVSGI